MKRPSIRIDLLKVETPCYLPNSIVIDGNLGNIATELALEEICEQEAESAKAKGSDVETQAAPDSQGKRPM